MVFVQVQVHRAGVVAMFATEECGCCLGCICFIVFVFTVALSRRETIHLDVDFKQFFHLIEFTQLHHMKLLFSPTQLLGTVGNNSVSVSKFFVWQPLWRVRQRKKTEIVFIGFACSMFTIKGSNTMSVSYIYRKKCSLADRMIPDLRHKPDDVCNQIHHPFTAGPLLANPLQEIGVIDLVIQVF